MMREEPAAALFGDVGPGESVEWTDLGRYTVSVFYVG